LVHMWTVFGLQYNYDLLHFTCIKYPCE